VVVNATIAAPEGVAPEDVRTQLRAANATLGTNLVSAVTAVPGISTAAVGSIAVDSVSIFDGPEDEARGEDARGWDEAGWGLNFPLGIKDWAVAAAVLLVLVSSVLCFRHFVPAWNCSGPAKHKTYRSLPLSDEEASAREAPEGAPNLSATEWHAKQPLLRAVVHNPNLPNWAMQQPKQQPPQHPPLVPRYLVQKSPRSAQSPEWHYRLRPVVVPATGSLAMDRPALLRQMQGAAQSQHPFAVPLPPPPTATHTIARAVGVHAAAGGVAPGSEPQGSWPSSGFQDVGLLMPELPSLSPLSLAPGGHLVAPISLPPMPAVSVATRDARFAYFESMLSTIDPYAGPSHPHGYSGSGTVPDYSGMLNSELESLRQSYGGEWSAVHGSGSLGTTHSSPEY